MNSTFKPLARCPGIAGVHCEALVDKSVRRLCLGLARLSKDAVHSETAGRDARRGPLHRGRLASFEPSVGGPISTNKTQRKEHPNG